MFQTIPLKANGRVPRLSDMYNCNWSDTAWLSEIYTIAVHGSLACETLVKVTKVAKLYYNVDT